MSTQAQTFTAIQWTNAGWTPVHFPVDANNLMIGGGPLFFVNASRDLIFVDHAGDSYEIQPFLKEFVRTDVRPASEANPDFVLGGEQA